MRRHLPLILVFMLPLLLLWPLPLVGVTHVLAAPDQEAAAHIWGLWAASQGGSPLHIDGTMVRYPDGASLHLVDPAHLGAFLLGQTASPALGYNLILIQGFWTLGLAGALLGQRVGAPLWLGAVLAMLSPPMLATPASGMTEAMGAGWVGIQLALFLQWLDRGQLRSGILAALSLAICAWSGPYNGVWAGIIDVALGAWWLSRGTRTWRVRARPLWIAAGAGVLVTPLLSILSENRAEHLPGSKSRSGIPEALDQPDIFRGGIQNGADLTDPFFPGVWTGGVADVSHTTYLGGLALILVVLAARRSRSCWPWIGGALGMLLLALGPHWHVLGRTIRFGDHALLAPAGWLMQVPPFDRMTHWYRAGAIAHLLLVPPLALAILSYPARIRALIGAGLLADLLWLAPLQWPLHHAPLPDATPLSTLPDTRALLEIPPVSADRPPPGLWRDTGALLQVQHGHATGGSPMGLGVSSTARAAQMSIESLIRSGTLDEGPLQTAMNEGFGWVVIYPEYRPMPRSAEQHLEACLGAPLHKEATIWVFQLDRQIPASCTRAGESTNGVRPSEGIDSP